MSTPDGRAGSFVRLWAQLDPGSRLLLLFKSEAKEAGSERAVVDMISTDLFDAFPTPGQNAQNAPKAPSLWSHAFWLAVEDPADPFNATVGVFGRVAGHAFTCSALVCDSAEDKAGWLLSLARASDQETMRKQTEDDIFRTPILSMSLLHNQLGASFFSRLRSIVERKVNVVLANKQLNIYSDVLGTMLVRVLDLEDERTRIVFACNDRSPQPSFSNLCIKITAPKAGSSNRALQVHVLRPRNSTELLVLARTLAAL